MLELSLNLNQETGLLENISYHPSPNYNDRPPNTEISLLVIHGISLPPGEFSGNAIDLFFKNQLDVTSHPYYKNLMNLQVSSHLLIRRDGSTIQYVPLQKRAWHAGQSVFAGKENCNDYSIGIELEGTDNIPYTMPQYQQLARVTQVLMQNYPAITLERIVGHNDIAPGRKTDPGPAFHWNYFRELLS